MKRLRSLALNRWTAQSQLFAVVLASLFWPAALFADDCERDWRRAED